MSSSGISGWLIVLATVALLHAAAKFLDEYYIRSSTRDSLRTYLIRFFVYLDNTPIPNLSPDIARRLVRFSNRHRTWYWCLCGLAWIGIPPWSTYVFLAPYAFVIVPAMAIWIGIFLLLTAHALARVKNEVVATSLAVVLPIFALIVVWHLSWKVMMPLYDFALDSFSPEGDDQDKKGTAALLILIGYAHYRVLVVAVFPIALIALTVANLFIMRTMLRAIRWTSLHVSNQASDPSRSPFGYLAALLNIAILAAKLVIEAVKIA